MAQERSEHDNIQGIALKALKNELGLAVKLLRQIKEARETLELESHVIEAARDAFRHAKESLEKMPMLAPNDMLAVQHLMDEFRLALANIGE